MAHTGKTYKLQFRRDLHLDLQNVDGWPEAFLINWQGLVTPFGSGISTGSFLCVNLLTSNQPPMVWVSASTLFDGQHWKTTVTFNNPVVRVGSLLTVDYKLERVGTGDVITWSGPSLTSNYRNIFQSALAGSGTIAPGYLWGIVTNTLVGSPALWGVYP